MNEHETSNRAFLEKKVKLPAIFLIVTAGIGILLNIYKIISGMLGIGSMGSSQELEKYVPWLTGSVIMALSVVGIIFALFIVFTSIKMMKMEKWGLAMTGAIVAMVPCVSPCCILGIPFGIWAIVALTNADVKAAFKP
jgi:cytochrome b subunit of formate dehydrogenase